MNKNIHRDSVNIIIKSAIPSLNTSFASALSYINKNNEHPIVGNKINIADIVFSKEELNSNNWLILVPDDIKAKVVNILKHWLKIDIQIIIQSEEIIQKEIAKQKNKDLESDREERQKSNETRIKANNFKFEDYEENPSKIPPQFIKNKYISIDDFRKKHPIYEFYASDYESKILEYYQEGDEIWHYSNFDDHWLGWQKELFMLIRGNKIVCSPLIRSRRVCF